MALPPALRAALPATLHSAEVMAPASPRAEAVPLAPAAAGGASAAQEAGQDPTHPFPPDHPYAKFIAKFKAMVSIMHAAYDLPEATAPCTHSFSAGSGSAQSHQLCVYLLI